jgi:hypothetical protein
MKRRRPCPTPGTAAPRQGWGRRRTPPRPAPWGRCRCGPSTALRRRSSCARSPNGDGAGRCRHILGTQEPSFVVRVLLWRARVFQHSIPHDERGSYWLSPSASPVIGAELVGSPGSFARERHSRSFIASRFCPRDLRTAAVAFLPRYRPREGDRGGTLRAASRASTDEFAARRPSSLRSGPRCQLTAGRSL